MSSIILKVGDVIHKHHFSSSDDGRSLTIGRAFSNDVILADPYIGPFQLKLHPADGEDGDWRVNNTDDTNPVFLNKKIVEGREFNIRSGDELTVGRTGVAIYNENHAVAETREFSITNWLHNHKFKPLITTAMIVLLVLVTLWMTYRELSSEAEFSSLSVNAIALVVFTLLWASVWSLAGHLLKRNHYFFSHLFFTALCFFLFVLFDDIHTYIDYLFSSARAGEVTEWIVAIVLWGLLLGFNLALVTYSSKAFRNGLVASVCILGTFGVFTYLEQEDYSSQPDHSVTIKPSYIPKTAPVSIDTYVENYNTLFDTLASADG
jgi:hypothetical protein